MIDLFAEVAAVREAIRAEQDRDAKVMGDELRAALVEDIGADRVEALGLEYTLMGASQVCPGGDRMGVFIFHEPGASFPWRIQTPFRDVACRADKLWRELLVALSTRIKPPPVEVDWSNFMEPR